MMKLSLYTGELHEILEQFRSRVYDKDLCYLASDLMDLHMMGYSEIQSAIKRSMMICRSLDIPLEAHFKPIYVSRSGQVLCDWRLSKLASKLIIINGHPSNPVVAKLQMKLLEKL